MNSRSIDSQLIDSNCAERDRTACVISDVRYGGIKVPVGGILIDIGSNLDLCFEKKITARMRGNNPQQMKKYGKYPIGENIIIWRGGE